MPLAKCYSLDRSMSMNFAQTALDESAKPRLCALFPGALGDFICLLPALHFLARTYAIDLLARSEFAAIAPRSVRVSSLERYEIRQLFMSDGADDQRVRQFFAHYRAVYSWFASQQPQFAEQLRRAAPGRAQLFPFRPGHFTGHQADFYLACVNAPSSPDPELLVALRAEAIEWRDAFYQVNGIAGVPRLIVAPGSGAREKNWPEENFLEIAHWWRDQLGGQVLVVLGPVERERGGVERLATAGIVASDLELGQLAALLAGGDLYLGNDSGVSHLAAAVGTRTVALFGPSDERQWAPRGPRVTILRRSIAGSPCHDPTVKPCPDHVCLAQLTPAQVLHELRKLPEIANLTSLGVGITV